MQRILVIISACVVLVASGVVHGVWTDRWSDQGDLAETAQRLEQLPMTIGAWHGNVVEMERDPNSSLAGMIARRYVNASNGKGVTILLACGRSGAVSVIDTERNAKITDVTVGKLPWGVAIR